MQAGSANTRNRTRQATDYTGSDLTFLDPSLALSLLLAFSLILTTLSLTLEPLIRGVRWSEAYLSSV